MSMWSSRMFWKLFVTYAVLNLATTLTFVVVVSGWQQELFIEQMKRRLHDVAALLRNDLHPLMSQGSSAELQAHIRQLGQAIGMRITLVTMDGRVLAETEKQTVEQVAHMENHKNRVELIQAAAGGRGTSQRVSPTLSETMLYVALRVDADGAAVGFVRTALPMTEIQAHVVAIQRLIWLVAVILSLGAIALTYVVAARVVQPVQTLTRAAESIAAGNFEHGVYVQSRDELGMLAGAFRRMSDRLEAREAQLRESRRRLATVLEGMAEGVIALDEHERIVLANAAAGRLLRFSPRDAEGRPLMEVVRHHAIHEALVEFHASHGPQRFEVELGDKDRRVLAINANLLSDEPSTWVILVLQDVTESRQLETMRQEFVANVSHELKTPLSSIKAYAETLTSGAIHDQENNVRFVQGIEEQAERLHQLIIDLLSLARIEAGQETFDIGAVNVAEMAAACLAEHQVSAESKNIRLTCQEELDDLAVRADEEGLRQILNNLIDNAVKYTPEGGGITIAWKIKNGDDRVVIEVKDTGIGIAPDQLARVFERFYRVDKARSRELGGTGLGLAIVKHLAQSFGGSVSAESKLREGSLFAVTLPKA